MNCFSALCSSDSPPVVPSSSSSSSSKGTEETGPAFAAACALAALITGGDSGIGRAVAVLFAREGCDVAICHLDEEGDAEDTRKAVEAEGALWEVIAPKIGGVTLDDGEKVAARHKLDGAPSVLFDAVAIIPSEAGSAMLAQDAGAKDFVSDAFAHCKFVGHSQAALALFAEARIPAELDAGFVALDGAKACKAFVARCADLRIWKRELEVDADADAFVKNAGSKRKG